jgi:hypothetical protein
MIPGKMSKLIAEFSNKNGEIQIIKEDEFYKIGIRPPYLNCEFCIIREFRCKTTKQAHLKFFYKLIKSINNGTQIKQKNERNIIQ